MRLFPILFTLLLCRPLAAAILFIEPQTPLLEIRQSLTLSVSGATGTLRWLAESGTITGDGTRAVYQAPETPGVYAITVLDDSGAGAVRVTVLPAGGLTQSFAPANAVWEVFVDRDDTTALAVSADGATLWKGSFGGVEQRDAYTGEPRRVYSSLDGLPHNRVSALVADGSGGVWAGLNNFDGGLAHISADGNIRVWQADTSALPDNMVSAVVRDALQPGVLWIGSERSTGRLARFDTTAETWEVFTPDNSGLPAHSLKTLYSDTFGVLWIGTFEGLARYAGGEDWDFYTPDNSPLPEGHIKTLLGDGQGGVLIGTESTRWAWEDITVLTGVGLTHLGADGTWAVYSMDHGLPANRVRSLAGDGAGGFWIGTIPSVIDNAYTGGGLLHVAADGNLQTFHENNGLPGRGVYPLVADGNGGVWAGVAGSLVRVADTVTTVAEGGRGIPASYVSALAAADDGLWVATAGGLGLRNANGVWDNYHPGNSPLPVSRARALYVDSQGTLWAGMSDDFGTYGGLVQRTADGAWNVYLAGETPLPHPAVTAIVSDGAEGVWVGTGNGGVARLQADGTWTVLNRDNSALPTDEIRTLLPDAEGGLWIGTAGEGLAHRHADGSWQVYHQDNSPLTSNFVNALLADSEGGLWVGGGDSNAMLAHLQADGNWRVVEDLPASWVNVLRADGGGGLWIGTAGAGLIHLRGDDSRQVYDSRNSGLPDNTVQAVDAGGGLWVGTTGGLAHLDFGRTRQLAGSVSDQAQALLSGQRAALVIHPRGQSTGYNQALAIDFMATHAYYTLHARGYRNDEVYFLSYKPDLDFNGDAYADFNLVDAPVRLDALRTGSEAPRDLRVADIHAAFEWATQQGRLDQPLLVIFVDHGLPGELLLDPGGDAVLTAQVFKTLLDSYQAATDNPVVVMLEACHTGTLLPALQAPGRVVVSSTGDGLAYYDDLGRTSFFKFYFDHLRQGEDFWHAWRFTRATLADYRWPFSQQQPQLADDSSLAPTLCLNGCFSGLPGVLTLDVAAPTGTVQPGERVDLDVQTRLDAGSVERVWASVLTPRIAAQRDAQGYSRLPAPVVSFRRGEDDRWQGQFSAFEEQGDYVFFVKAKDSSGFITEAQPVSVVSQAGRALQAARFDGSELWLPVVSVDGGGEFQVRLHMHGSQWAVAEITPAVDPESAYHANFSVATGRLYVPYLAVGEAVFSVVLQLQADGEGFVVVSVE